MKSQFDAVLLLFPPHKAQNLEPQVANPKSLIWRTNLRVGILRERTADRLVVRVAEDIVVTSLEEIIVEDIFDKSALIGPGLQLRIGRNLAQETDVGKLKRRVALEVLGAEG